MQCKQAADLLADYLEGELDEELRGGLEEHLDACETCARELQEIRDMMKELSSIEVADPGQAFWLGFPGRVRQRLQAHAEGNQMKRFVDGLVSLFTEGWKPMLVGVAAASMVFVLVPYMRAGLDTRTGYTVAAGPDTATLAASQAYVHEYIREKIDPRDLPASIAVDPKMVSSLFRVEQKLDRRAVKLARDKNMLLQDIQRHIKAGHDEKDYSHLLQQLGSKERQLLQLESQWTRGILDTLEEKDLGRLILIRHQSSIQQAGGTKK